MEGDEKKKSKMMFSFPTQLMELYSECQDPAWFLLPSKGQAQLGHIP